jgi:Sec-independent protein translocase protein TatA
MCKRIILFCIAYLVMIPPSSGQSLGTRVTDAKMKVMKAALEFLVTDSAGKKIPQKICKSCSSYSELKQFAAVNNVHGGNKLIDQWQTWRLDTLIEENASARFLSFVNKVDSSITSGDHISRKSLDSYQEYKDHVAAIKIVFSKETKSTFSDEVSDNDHSAVPIDVNNEKVPVDFWLSFTKTTYGLVGVILILIVFIVFNRIKLSKVNSKLTKELSRIRKERDELKIQRDNLTYKLEELQVIRLDEKSQLELLKEEQQTSGSEKNGDIELAANTVVWDKPEVPQKIQEIFYSRYADLLDGFSASELLSIEGNDTIFKITMRSPNTASFEVSDNPAAQRYALSNADYFLERTCHYDALPSGTIITETPGKLFLFGGKWEIKEQARISFQ